MEYLSNRKIELIKNQLSELYKNNVIIHVSIKNGRKRVISAPCKLVSVYANFVCVQSEVNKYMENFTIHYRDIMINNIIIDEIKL